LAWRRDLWCNDNGIGPPVAVAVAAVVVAVAGVVVAASLVVVVVP